MHVDSRTRSIKRPGRKLWASGVASVAVAALLASTVTVWADEANRDGVNGVVAPKSTAALSEDFRQAAADHSVPQTVLMALSYAQSGWNTTPGAPLAGAAYGPMSLIDGEAVDSQELPGQRAGKPVTGSLQQAAELTGIPAETLKSDPAANIDAAAALLAKTAQREGAPVSPTDINSWYPVVVSYAGGESSSRDFADEVYSLLASGVTKVLPDGEELTLPADPAAVRAGAGRVARSAPLSDAPADLPAPECPVGLPCTFTPAYYGEFSGTYGRYYQANRTAADIRYIVIHDIEGSAQSAINLFRQPGYSSANYVISETGEVTQMIQNKDMPWSNGNMWTNQNSITIELAGYAADPSSYTDASYEATAKLVSYLAEKYDVPLNRNYIVGHNNIPGTNARGQKLQHWDPGPYYDWNRLLTSAGAQPPAVASGAPAPGSIVEVNSDYQANRLAFDATRCSAVNAQGPLTGMLPARSSSVIWARTEPRADAPLISDPVLNSNASYEPTGEPGTNRACDWGTQISSGQRFVVAETKTQPDGTWVGVWYTGQKAWFKLDNVVTVRPVAGQVAQAAAGFDSVPVWNAPYPNAADYPYSQEHTNTPEGYWDGFSTPERLPYTIPAGQAYTVTGPISASYFNAGSLNGNLTHDRTWIRGEEQFYQLQLNHRFVYVKASDLQVSTVELPVTPPTPEPTVEPTTVVTPSPTTTATDSPVTVTTGEDGASGKGGGQEDLAVTGAGPGLFWVMVSGILILLIGALLLVTLSRRSARH